MTPKHDDEHLWGYLWREALLAMSLGWNLALPIFGGVLLGHFLDGWLGTGLNFTLGLLMLGVGLGYYNLARFIRRLDRRDYEQMPGENESEQEPEMENNQC